VRDAACSVENRVSLVVMRCANVYRAKRRCPLQYRITVCRTSFISLKTTNQEMPSSESGLTLSLLPYAVGAGEHGSPGVVATVPPTAIVPKVFGNTKEVAVCALAESTERRETPGGGEQQSGRRRNKISETFRSGHQAGLRASAPASTSAASLQVVKKISHSFWLMDLRAVDGSIFVGAVACWHIASQGETEMVEIGSPIYSSAWHLNLSRGCLAEDICAPELPTRLTAPVN